MYSFKEKKTHFVALRNPDVAQYDLELLAKEVPGFPQLATFSRNPKRYADDILYALLDCATREEIREYRRAMIAKKAKEAEDAGEKKTKGPATKKTAGKNSKCPKGKQHIPKRPVHMMTWKSLKQLRQTTRQKS